MKRLSAFLALTVFLVSAETRPDAPAPREKLPPQPPRPLTVPFELIKSKHIVIKVKLNGKGPYRLIFDTGAPVTLLNNKVANESGVIPKNFKKPFFSLFGSMGDFKIASLQAGDVTAKNVSTIVMDHPTVGVISKAFGPIEGIVGFSFFARYRMTIDYQALKLTFVPVPYQPPDAMENMMKMLTEGGSKKVVAPAGQWGFRIYKDAKDTGAGVEVKEVFPGTAAAAAGLKAGDRLLVMDRRWIDAVADCYTVARHVPPGQEATLVIRRQGKEMQLKVKVKAGL